MRREGFSATALAAMPTFTNPNNVSIVCGVPPAVHGVSGNFYIDRETGREIMMVDATPVRAPTILAAFSHAGAGVVAITAKDKLRKALGRELKGIAFSAEKADACTEVENGIADIAGVSRGGTRPISIRPISRCSCSMPASTSLKARGPDLIYLSLSDYVQHKHAPEEPEALAFMQEVDTRLGQLVAAGAVVGIVADHGMTDMAKTDGEPNVLYLGDRLDAAFGFEATHVVCPITDPFVRHHGAMGGFVRVHLMQPDLAREEVAAFVRALPGVALALSREEACARFELPEDREGDIAVIADKGVALGARAADHDSSQLAGTRLRSHGGVAERAVPFILSHPLRRGCANAADSTLFNYDIFAFALNRVEA